MSYDWRATASKPLPDAMFAHSNNTLASHTIIVCVYACIVGCYEFAGTSSVCVCVAESLTLVLFVHLVFLKTL